MKSNRLWVLSAFAMLALSSLGLAQEIGIETVGGRDIVAREVLIKLAPGATMQQLGQALDVESTQPVGDAGVIRVKSRSLDAATLIDRVGRNPVVAWSEPNYIIRASDTTPNEPQFAVHQWALRNTGQTIVGQAGTPGADIQAVKAWDKTTGLNSVLVGILDTGVDYTHPDLAANIWSAPAPFTLTFGALTITCPVGSHGFNAIAFSCDPQDDNLHGTHVAGVIGAVGNNGTGVAGVNWTTAMVSLKWMNFAGYGSSADAANTIYAAIQMKAQGNDIRILNAAWGDAANSMLLEQAIIAANTAGILFVAGAGNNSNDNDGAFPFYPASYPQANIIAVAATDNQDKLASFSNFGATKVDLGAPGVNIQSTIPGSGYATYSGTSLATAHVTGVAALLLAECPSITTVPQLKSAILNTVDLIPSLTGKTFTGGRLNAYRALVACDPSPAFTMSAAPLAMSVIAGAGTSSLITVTPTNAFSGTLNLSLTTPVVVGLTASVPPTVGVPAPGSFTLNIGTTAATPAGKYSIVVKGDNLLGVTYSLELSLTVNRPDFTVSASPISVSLNPGGAASTKITVGSLFGFSGIVTLSTLGLPAGVTGSFVPPTVTTAGDSTLNLTALASAVPNSYVFTVQGVSGALTRAVLVNLLINTPDFSMSASPSSVAAAPGSATSSSIITTALNGFNGLVNLTVSGLPPGVTASLSPSVFNGGGASSLGLTVGILTVPGTYSITVTGTSGALVRTAIVKLNVIGALTITTLSLGTGQVGIPYSKTLTATGGIGPYRWSVISGRLPRGFMLNEYTGVITGTPIELINASFTFEVTDATTPVPNTATASLVLVVIAPGFAITTPALPSAPLLTPYSQTLTSVGGLGPYTWSVVPAGSLPPGLFLNPVTGEIFGTPTVVGSTPVTFQVTDSNFPAQVATKVLTVTVTLPNLVITTASLAPGQAGLPYIQPLTAVGGVTPYHWKIVSGRLPGGLAFNEATGVISGIPLTGTPGGSVLTFKVTDSTAPFPLSATVTLLLNVAP